MQVVYLSMAFKTTESIQNVVSWGQMKKIEVSIVLRFLLSCTKNERIGENK